MEEKNKKKIFMIGMSALLILILVIGGTYAWFTLQLNGTKVNVLKAGTLSLILNDENSIGINQEKEVPMLDEVGETLDPYHFTLENHGEMPSEYTIYLDDIDLEESETRMDDSFVKYQLVKDGTKTTALLSTTGIHPNRVLDSGTIDENTTITYDLRLWIDEHTGNEVMGTTLRTKIRVVATQAETSEPRNEHILAIYRYDATSCLTGEEATCVEIKQAPKTYKTGTIVKYKVNENEEKYFHVISDNGDTLTMQQRENTLSATKWYDGGNGDDNSQGPLTVLPALESATASWTNVKDQTYTLGTTTFKNNAATGCTFDSTTKEIICAVNTYTLPKRTSKARMITAQEVGSLGCKYSELQSCPTWIYNYLSNSIGNGGTETGTDYGYWTMSSTSSVTDHAVNVYYDGRVRNNLVTNTFNGARAVVIVNK